MTSNNKNMDIGKMVYTVNELSKLLNIGTNKAYELTHRKDFPVVEIGKRRLILKSALEKWLEDHCTSAM